MQTCYNYDFRMNGLTIISLEQRLSTIRYSVIVSSLGSQATAVEHFISLSYNCNTFLCHVLTVCALFDDAVSTSEYPITPNGKIIGNNLERVNVASARYSRSPCLVRPRKTMTNISQDSWCLSEISRIKV